MRCGSTSTSRAVAASSWRAACSRARCPTPGRSRCACAAPATKLELKLVDPTNRNVWWWHRDAFEFPVEWQPLRIRSSEVSFAWGPAGGGALRDLAAIEIAIAAPPGGSGTVWLEDLRLE